MAKAGRGADQYMLRFPAGLRDRVKAYAELQGRSMNDEIIRILEREFPEPESIADRVSDLIGLTAVLKGAAGNSEVERLTSALIDTVRRLADGTIQGVDEGERDVVSSRLSYWEESFAEDENTRAIDGLDQVEVEAMVSGRSTAKYPLEREWRKYARSFTDREVSEVEEDSYGRGFDAGYQFANSRTRGGDLDEDLDH